MRNYSIQRTRLSLLLLLIVNICISQPVGINWVKQIKGLASVISVSSDLKVDGMGNIFTCGRFSQTYDFDPGPGVYTLSTNGACAFVAKYDPNGSLIWAKKFDDTNTSSSFGVCNAITTDNSGNVYCTGSFNNTFDFDPGPSTYTLNSTSGVCFICKLNSIGNFVWAGQIGRDSAGVASDILINSLGNLVLCGNYKKPNNDFDPTASSYTINPTGIIDAYILTLSPSGSFISLSTLGGSQAKFSPCYISEDLNGNLLVTGQFKGTADFDPGVNSYTMNSTNGDAFTLRMAGNGTFLNAWKVTSINSGSSYGNNIVSDNSNNVYVVYSFNGQNDFDPGPAILTFSAIGFQDIAICKFNASGNLIWCKQISGIGNDYAYDIDINSNNELFISIYFDNTIDVDPGIGTFTLAPQTGPNTDVGLIKLDNTGNYIWSRSISGSWHKTISAVEIDLNGNLFVAGTAQQGADFDPGPGPSCTSTISALYYDPYILKLSPCSAPLAPVVNPSVVTSCGSASFALNASSANSLTWRTQLMSNTYIDSVAAIHTGMLAPGNYTYYAAAWNCCAESFPPAQVNVSVFPIPTISLIASKDTFCIGEPVVLTAQGGVSYVMGTTFSSGNFTVWPSQNTTYTVNGGDINNCVNTASIQLIYDPCTTIAEQWLEQAVAVWPNPTADMVKLAITRNGVYTVEVYDNLGRLLFTKKIDIKDATPVTFNFSHQGVYQLVITSEGSRVVKKVVVE